MDKVNPYKLHEELSNSFSFENDPFDGDSLVYWYINLGWVIRSETIAIAFDRADKLEFVAIKPEAISNVEIAIENKRINIDSIVKQLKIMDIASTNIVELSIIDKNLKSLYIQIEEDSIRLSKSIKGLTLYVRNILGKKEDIIWN